MTYLQKQMETLWNKAEALKAQERHLNHAPFRFHTRPLTKATPSQQDLVRRIAMVIITRRKVCVICNCPTPFCKC